MTRCEDIHFQTQTLALYKSLHCRSSFYTCEEHRMWAYAQHTNHRIPTRSAYLSSLRRLHKYRIRNFLFAPRSKAKLSCDARQIDARVEVCMNTWTECDIVTSVHGLVLRTWFLSYSCLLMQCNKVAQVCQAVCRLHKVPKNPSQGGGQKVQKMGVQKCAQI